MEVFLVDGEEDERLDVGKLFAALSSAKLSDEDAEHSAPWVCIVLSCDGFWRMG